jgi:hypothetical protein
MEKMRVNNDDEGIKTLSEAVQQTMKEVADDYNGTPEDVMRVVTYILKQKEKAGFSTPIQVPRNEVEQRILDAIAERFAAKDAAKRQHMISSTGEVLGSVDSKTEAMEKAREQRDAI